jgi:UDP-N-acetylmuramoyl-tripeptide--D-alanyl-D-alanine ligase
MIELSLEAIAGAVEGQLMFGDPAQVVSGKVSTDSRELGDGDIFFAKLGEKDDGHRYLSQVRESGVHWQLSRSITRRSQSIR